MRPRGFANPRFGFAVALVLVAGIAYGSPCGNRRIVCTAKLETATAKCEKDVECHKKAHDDFVKCVGGECSY